MIGCCSLIIISIGSRCTVLILCEQQQSDYRDGQFLVGALAAVAFSPSFSLMCRHLPDGGKLTLTNFHFTHYENGHAV